MDYLSMLTGLFGQPQAMNFQNAFGQGNPYQQGMPNLMEYSSVPMPSSLQIDNSMAQPGVFPTMQGMPDPMQNQMMNQDQMMNMARLAGTFNREPREMPRGAGISMMNQMPGYQWGQSRMFKR